jgi:hypothetical protein
MVESPLVAYQNPVFKEKRRFSDRIVQQFADRKLHRTYARYRDPCELRQFFDLYKASDKLRFTSNLKAIETEPFLLLDLVAYYNLSPRFPKNKAKFSIYEALSRQELNQLRDSNGKLFLNLSVEAFFPREFDVQALHQELAAWAINPEQVFLLNNNQLSEKGYHELCDRLGIAQRINMLPFHGNYWLLVGRKYCESASESRLEAEAKLNARVDRAFTTVKTGQKRPFKFINFNGKIRPHRVCLVLFLMSRNLLEVGQASLLAFESQEQVNAETFRKMLQPFSISAELDDWIEPLIAKLPMVLDINPIQAGASVFDSQDPQLYDNSYFSIVTDTMFLDESLLFLTEKPFKSFLNLHPFVYIGNPGALAEFRRMGYQTFHPWIDETYDTELDHDKRMMLILQEIDRLSHLTIEQLHEMYCQLWDRILSNYQTITSAAPNYFATAQSRIWDRCGYQIFRQS